MAKGEGPGRIFVAGIQICLTWLLKVALLSTIIFSPACFLARVPAVASASKGATFQAEQPEGFWQDSDKADYKIALEGQSLTISYGGRVREVGAVLEATPESANVCRFGRENIFRWQFAGDSLIFQDVDRQETHRMIRLPRKPADLGISSFHLAQPMTLSEARISQIQRELYQRQQRDQESLRASAPSRPSVMDDLPWLRARSSQSSGPLSARTDLRFAETVSENTDYIRRLLAEVGWIDVERLGYATSKSAFLLVQHSWEPPLILAVLPELKRDVDAGRMDADAYVLLFDRLQLALGRRQRFGSQVATDETGALVVLPVEDPSKVDALRRDRGLIPLKEYVHVLGASEVRFSQACKDVSLAGDQIQP